MRRRKRRHLGRERQTSLNRWVPRSVRPHRRGYLRPNTTTPDATSMRQHRACQMRVRHRSQWTRFDLSQLLKARLEPRGLLLTHFRRTAIQLSFRPQLPVQPLHRPPPPMAAASRFQSTSRFQTCPQQSDQNPAPGISCLPTGMRMRISRSNRACTRTVGRGRARVDPPSLAGRPCCTTLP